MRCCWGCKEEEYVCLRETLLWWKGKAGGESVRERADKFILALFLKGKSNSLNLVNNDVDSEKLSDWQMLFLHLSKVERRRRRTKSMVGGKSSGGYKLL